MGYSPPLGYLEHVQVAVAIAGLERFHRHRDQEVALSGMADAFAARGMAYCIDLMEWMGYVIGQGRLFEHPLRVRQGQAGHREK